jgi:hypothetical protein
MEERCRGAQFSLSRKGGKEAKERSLGDWDLSKVFEMWQEIE